MNPQSDAEENRNGRIDGLLSGSEVSLGYASPIASFPLPNHKDTECYRGMLLPVKQAGEGAGERFQQVQRLLASRSLQGAESLRRLLQYLAQRSLNGRAEPVKEYQIAIEAFGRPSEFDPQTDATVRVQMRRLRSKLSEYYGSEGIHDPVIIEIPRGSYSLSFRLRAKAVVEDPRLTAAAAIPETSPTQVAPAVPTKSTGMEAPPARRKLASLAWAAIVLLIATLALVEGARLIRSQHQQSAAIATSPDVLQRFWHPFLTADEPWVVFSNAAFVGRPETGMHYYRGGASAADEPISRHYSGVGEVLGVLSLDRMFSRLGFSFRAKRASMFSIDDAQNSNLIFVGSPAEDLPLLKLPAPREFSFARVPAGKRQGDLGITNHNPQPGEEKMYLPSAPSQPLRLDYALIVLTHSLDLEHSMLILAGTTTIGTQAAVEYVCDQKTLSELMLRLQSGPSGEVTPFEALIRVHIEQDVPVATDLVAVRVIPSQ